MSVTFRMHWFGARYALVLNVLAFAVAVQAAQTLTGHVPAHAKSSRAIGPMAQETVLHLSIGLPLRNCVALTNLLEQLYNPASPRFRKFLSVTEFTEQFGPSQEDYSAVVDFLKEQGFAISTLHPNRVLIEFSGTVAQAETAFHIRLNRYQHPVSTREFYAPDADPSLDLAVPVLDITGLDNFSLPRPASLIQRSVPPASDARPMAGSGPNGAYMGFDFRAAYAPNVLLNGSGQYVGLVQFDGYYPGDIAAYVSRAGLTNVPLTNILLDGVDGTPGTNNVEVALDIEMTISMAPGLAGVMVYQGRSGNSILNRMATDNVAKQLSASWTYPANGTTSQIFQQFAAQGQSYFNASGDDGAYSGSVHQPTDNPYITSVGGTTLSTRGPGQAWSSETAWNWPGNMASGGGISPTWAIPSWQGEVSMALNQGSTTMRNIPDVAMVADNVFVISNNGQESYVGGTSVASPLWAAYLALANQQASLSGLSSVGFINPVVYATGLGAGYSTAFHDVRSGNNTNAASPNAFYAVAGFDLCTGWGTPSSKSLLNALAPPPNRPVLVPSAATLATETCVPTNGAADPGEVVILSLSLQNYGGLNTTNLVATLLSTNGIVPISVTRSYGVVAQGSTVSRQFTLIPTGTCGAVVNSVLQLQDGTADLGTVAFSIPLGAPATSLTEKFDSVAVPALPSGWTRAVLNSASNWVTSTSLRDTSPNAAFALDAATPGTADLISPLFAVLTPSAQLTFRHNYNLEADSASPTNAFDGAVLDIKIGTGGFRDILLQGGTFAVGGYTRTLTSADNPLRNRQCWSGNSGGFVTTTVNLPSSAAGQNVQLKWRLGMNTGNAYTVTGWYVDSISVKDGFACCTPATNADISISQSIYPDPAAVGSSVACTLTVKNLGPGPATSVVLSNALPPNSTFNWASPGYTNSGDGIVWDLGLLPLGRVTNLTILVTPTAGATLTNIASVSTASDDSVLTNNLSVSIVTLAMPPQIVLQPSDQVATAGTNVTFQVTAAGTEPLTYQWAFSGGSLLGKTESILVLTNVQPAQAGPYSVTVSNAAGSTNSLSAILKVLVPPLIPISGVVVTATNISVSVNSVAGITYILESKDAISAPLWIPASAPVLGTGDAILLQDTNAQLPLIRFYRVNCTP